MSRHLMFLLLMVIAVGGVQSRWGIARLLE